MIIDDYVTGPLVRYTMLPLRPAIDEALDLVAISSHISRTSNTKDLRGPDGFRYRIRYAYGTAISACCPLTLKQGIYSVIASFFLCRPFSFIETVHCLPRKAKWFSDAGINIATDVILLVLPMPSLKGLNIPKRQKFELIGVFALGAL